MVDCDSNVEELIRKAQLGDKSCFEQLVRLAEPRLRADVYRLTLDAELTAEIVQETIVEMFKILGQLRDVTRFWPWLYKIAVNKFRLYHRKQIQHKTVPLSSVDPESPRSGALANLIGDELKQAIFDAMRRVKPEHRTILTLRCYRDMDYSMIAESLGCSPFAAKMRFFRAKKAISRQLSRHGFGRGSLFIGLALFGKMTAESNAAAAELSVGENSVKVGAAVNVIGTLFSGSGIATVSTIGILGVGSVMMTDKLYEQGSAAKDDFVPASTFVSDFNEQVSQQEYWYYYPQGASGPVMIRLIKKDAQGRGSYYVMRQNEEGNYQFDENINTIYIRNCRMWNPDFSVRCLPTDRPGLRRFLSSVEGVEYQTQYVPYDESGLLVIATEGLDTTSKPATVTHMEHLLDEEYFHYNLPVGAKVVDQRDEMHKRGWTYFSISGDINGKLVNGKGRIPFVYATSRDYCPWMELIVGDDLRIVDSGRKAGSYEQSGQKIFAYPSGVFFRGLPRPWMGLHVLDTVRRDAAEKGLKFETKISSDTNRAEVTVFSAEQKLVYTIDMQNDLVDKIEFFVSDSYQGKLKFLYMQNIEKSDGFASPVVADNSSRLTDDPGIFWLFKLAQEKPEK